MWTFANSNSLVKKGKSTPPTPYFTITSGTATRTLTPDGSYNVYLITGNATATIFNTANTTIQCLLIGKGGISRFYTASGYYSGGGGAGAFIENTYVLQGNSNPLTINFTFDTIGSKFIVSGSTIYTAGIGGEGGNGRGNAATIGSNGSSGGGGGAPSIINGASGSPPGNSGSSGANTSSAGGGGGAGSNATELSSSGGTGKSPVLPGINSIYGSTVYCVGGTGATTSGHGTQATTYGSGSKGNRGTATIGSNTSTIGQPGAIMIAIHVNDIPSPTP